ncbi:MAG: Fic family protein [Desulfobacula sp.]|uniref:Fic family protein n=1 Tax=Desulfobacula sp. TaxID=2593537 RepID=UPI001D79EE4C|nr:Fic family protein [Desulfobacula sp.]MBT3483707.1 Fic family protein [Desulfobacula sp.]MBT3803518.1 Fic family protein [Desulfobacula sp.]MBT4023313.1 Fic family protein [Desulfobacula sp.]MBT4197298.1 Fic family protein [Desulfobacula sp.]
MKYIWQTKSWPGFKWDYAKLLKPLGNIRFSQGSLITQIKELGFEIQQSARADVLVEEALKTSAIEGEKLDPDAVRSSVGRRLGLPDAGLKDISDQKAEGLVEILLDATINYSKEMSLDRIWGWHAALFPTGYSGMVKISVGQWRDDSKGPMQVVSGPIGQEKVHFEAPPAKNIDKEMQAFTYWVNTKDQLDGIIRAGLAHIWFVTIHPFDDGNGRIARTLTDMLLARDENNPKRFYSLSSQIMAERNEYYEILKAAQAGTGDITQWLTWFLECMNRAILNSHTLFRKIMIKALFWQEFAQTRLHERQTKVINRLLDAGSGGFECGLKNKKYMGIAHTSRATAQRELSDLVKKGILIKMPGGGRSASYDLDWEKWSSLLDYRRRF